MSPAATVKCPSPMMDLIDAATKVTMTCTDDADCNVAFATCKAGEVKVNDVCHPLLPPNGFLCYYKEQCSGGSTCVDYQCTCPAGFTTIVNNVCTGPGGVTATTPLPGVVTTPIPSAVTTPRPGAVSTTATTVASMCTGNTVRIGTQCMIKRVKVSLNRANACVTLMDREEMRAI
uniref:EB domain-containing protein n=1 Tax=Plectus sambesii TaxID=2011161 RepID=A0A914XPM8_9BILA